MRFSLRVAALAVLVTAGSVLAMGACGGSAFQAEGSSGGAGGGGAGAGGSAPLTPCTGPDSCDDGDPCTTDFCSTEGACAWASKCPGGKCCAGECAECCGDDDCEDGIGCTEDVCFASRCMFVPDDASCAAGEYCSVTSSCQPKVACLPGDSVPCEDQSTCTTDACVGGFCEHEFCAEGAMCCDGGCAVECCDDAQCNSDDPCMVGACVDGKCQVQPLCAEGERCCPSAGGGARCGECCSATDCDDRIDCTEDTCTGARLACRHRADDARCKPGQACHPTRGCEAQVQCGSAQDCTASGCGRCESGFCRYDCPTGQACCAATNACAGCCGDLSCDDAIACTVDKCTASGCTHVPDDSQCNGGVCLVDHKGCVPCDKDEHCNDNNSCTTDKCDVQTHECSHISTCQCQTGFDCAGVMADAIPIGGTCHACVDGKCQVVACSGNCCSSGCYMGLCPD